MKIIATALALLALMYASIVHAHTLSFAVKSKYVLSKGVEVYDKPVAQTDLLLNLPHGFCFDLFWSTSLDNADFNSDFGDEINWTLCWSGVWRSVAIDLGVGYLDLVDLFSLNGGDVIQPYMVVTRPFSLNNAHTIAPYFRLEAEFPIKWDGLDARKGVHIFVGASHLWQLFPDWLVTSKLALVYDTGTFTQHDAGMLVNYEMSIGWNINPELRLDLATYRLSVPLSVHDRGTENIFGGGVSYSFP